MTTPMKWCDKGAALAKELHEANVACDKTEENHQEVLSKIGVKVAEHVGHKGKIPTFHSIRAKLRSMDVYVAATTATKPSAAGTVISKASIVKGISEKLGTSDLSTLVNANRADLEAVAKNTAALVGLSVFNATREQLESALEALEDSEVDAIIGGASPAVIAEIEQVAAETALPE